MEIVSFFNEGLPVLIDMEHEKRENLCLNFPEVAEVATGILSSEFSVKPYEIEVVPENLAQQCVLGAIEVDKFHLFEFGHKDIKTYAALCGRDWFYLRENGDKKELCVIQGETVEYKDFPPFEKIEELIELLPWWWKE